MRLLTLIFILCYVLNLFSASAEPETEFSFRNGIKFGMSRQQVKHLENNSPYQEDGEGLAYINEKAAGKDATIVYLFENDMLYNIGVMFTEEHSNDNLYIKDFESIDKSLKEKYGDPTYDAKQIWLDDLYKSDSNEWGFAISCGDLVYITTFENSVPSVTIMHALKGDNYEISHLLFYESDEYITNSSSIDGI